MAETRWPILYWHYSHLGSFSTMESHRPIIRALCGPALSCHVCAWMDFWYFLVLLLLSSFILCHPSGVYPLCTYVEPSLDIYPPVVKPGPDFSPHQSQWRRWHLESAGESLDGKQESGEMNAPSGLFISIHQLPGCTPKIEKPLFSSLLCPRQALSMC